MYKYIQDEIRNNSRLILSKLSLPQKKAIMETIRGLFVAETHILRHLAQNEKINAKKQGDKYSYHLGNIDLKEKVEQSALNKVKNYQKFVNLIGLIQFAINVSIVTFIKIQKSTYSLISGVLIYYKKFLKLKVLTFNLDSFISFIKSVLQPLVTRPQKPPPSQLFLLSRRQLEKLGPF